MLENLFGRRFSLQRKIETKLKRRQSVNQMKKQESGSGQQIKQSVVVQVRLHSQSDWKQLRKWESTDKNLINRIVLANKKAESNELI